MLVVILMLSKIRWIISEQCTSQLNVRCIVSERVTHRFARRCEHYTYFIDMKYYEIRLSSANSAYNNDMTNYRENKT
jgi:hypothetical protein